ncbi:hypothetical protein D920_02345 [Enterococcus faecalis 13-SD-W-01]|nr:hypothetical protein D920_02345 [Enterococcus faecalis 13-SD-W-01]
MQCLDTSRQFLFFTYRKEKKRLRCYSIFRTLIIELIKKITNKAFIKKYNSYKNKKDKKKRICFFLSFFPKCNYIEKIRRKTSRNTRYSMSISE